jgi:hypothetical protein
MRPSSLLCLGLAASLFVFFAPGCGADTVPSGTGTTGDPPVVNDGNLHPAGNGTPISEDAACAALLDGQAQHVKSLGGCVSTSPVCPGFLRAQSGAECLQYDEGAMKGCLDIYSATKSCAELSDARARCYVAPIAGSAPKGCSP